MNTVIQIIGIIFVLIAIVYLIKPAVLQFLMEFFKKGKRMYLAGLIRLALAIVFLLAATKCNKPKVIGAFGILFLISGLLIFMLGPEKIKSILEWWQKQSLLLIRIIAVIPLAFGVIIIICA